MHANMPDVAAGEQQSDNSDHAGLMEEYHGRRRINEKLPVLMSEMFDTKRAIPYGLI